MNIINLLTSNHWATFALVSVILMIVIGLRQYDVRHLKLIRRYSWKRFRLWAVIFGCVFTIMVLAESASGIVQLLDDNIIGPGDSNAWSVYLLPFASMSAGAVLTLALFFIGVNAGRYSKKVILERKLSPETKAPDEEGDDWRSR